MLFSDRRLARSVHHVGGEASFGNSWQFSSFTIGCDWAGYFMPFKKVNDTREQSGATRGLFGTQVNDDKKDEDFHSEQR